MKLLFTLKSFNENLLLKYDTEKEDGELIGSVDGKFIHTSGLVYSGNYLCIGCYRKFGNDKIVFLNIHSDEKSVFTSENAKNITSIISIYPGKLYFDSKSNGTIVSADFDCINLSEYEDTKYYSLDINKSEIQAFLNYKNVWFLADKKANKIIDLTNNRIVYSDIYDPQCLFFNSNQRLCFIEAGRQLFHCGDDIFKVGKNPTTAIEDIDEGGYWIVCGTELHLVDYYGDLIDIKDLSEFGVYFNNVVEAKGKTFSK